MEEAKSVIGVICSSYDSFFDSEKKIANCIMERKREVVDMTVAELAQASGASDASVSRFCRRCGFKGFHQLKMTLARELSEESQASVGNDISRRDIGQSLQNILANNTADGGHDGSRKSGQDPGYNTEGQDGTTCGGRKHDTGRFGRRIQV